MSSENNSKLENLAYNYAVLGSLAAVGVFIYKIGGDKILKKGYESISNSFRAHIEKTRRLREMDEEFTREQEERMVCDFDEPSDREIEGYDPDLDDAFEDPDIRYP